MTADPWQTLGAKLPGEDEENDRMEIAGFADQYNVDLDGEVLAEEVPVEGVPPPRFAAAEAESPPDEEEGMVLADGHSDLPKPQQPRHIIPPFVAPVSIAPVRTVAPKTTAPVAPAMSTQSARAPQKIISSPEADERGPVDEEEGELGREPGVPGPRGAEPPTAVAHRARWPLVAALAGGVVLLGGVGTVAFLKSATPAHGPVVQPVPAPPAAPNTVPLQRRSMASTEPPSAPAVPAGLGASSSPSSAVPVVAGLAIPGSGPSGVSSTQNDATVLPSTPGTGSVSVPLASAVAVSATPASSHTIASQLARLERSFQGIKFLVGQITQKESALATAVQKEQTTSVRDAAVIARQGREIAHLTWLVHHAPRITMHPLAPPKPKPQPKPLVPPVQLVGIIGHAAWIEVPNGALVRIFRGNPIPGTPKLSVRSIQANPPLLILSNGVDLREAGP